MLIPILIGLAILIVLFLIFVSQRPSDFRVSRSLAMNAPTENIFEQVNVLRRWEAWNPWAKADPKIKITYAGPPAGVGASYAWTGNNQVGAGCNTVIESKPNELVRFRLEFFKPMKGINTAEFTFKNEGPKTLVTWTMTGKNNFAAKAFGLIMNCDNMIGGQFEKGLAAMKTVAEGAAPKQPADLARGANL